MEQNAVLLQSLFDLCAQGNSNLQLAVNIIRRKNKRLAILQNLTKMKKMPITRGFLQEISEMPHNIFYSQFGMGKMTFDKLLNLLNSCYKRAETGRPGIELKVCLLITLWKLTNQNSFREVSDRFNVGRGACYRVFVNCVQMIAKQKQLINFPNTESSRRKIMASFEKFPNVVGCIGCTHIRISQPSHDNISYYNRNGRYSIIAQAVVDSEMRFLDVFVGHPGSYYNSSLWTHSPLKRAITSERIVFPSNCHLLGDASYPLENYMMVPFRDNEYLTAAQTRFNYILSSTRVCLEHAFVVLKNKFRILNYLDIRDIKLAKTIIMSCFILHNFIIDTEGVADNTPFDSKVEIAPDNIAVDDDGGYSESYDIPFDNNTPEQAKIKREMLATFLST